MASGRDEDLFWELQAVVAVASLRIKLSQTGERGSEGGEKGEGQKPQKKVKTRS